MNSCCNCATRNYNKLQCVATTHVLHKTTNATTQNYRLHCTKLCYTTDKTACTCNTYRMSKLHSNQCNEVSTYVTGFAKTVPIGTTIEIHFMA